ncbi:MAG: amylo-alpha-1,6-glucosidase [Planctomycetota bacterium]
MGHLFRLVLELTGKSQWANGCLPVMSPGNTEDYNMIACSCYWVAKLAEYLRHTSDTHFVNQMFDKVKKHIEYETRFIDKNGLLFETPSRRFLSWADGRPRKPYAYGETWQKKDRKTWGDWLDEPTRGYNAIINTYWLWSLREATCIAEIIGENQKCDLYKTMFENARAAFDEVFWEEQFGLYRDNVYFDRNGNKNKATFCESTLFLMMRAEIIDKQKGLECFRKITDPDFICCRSSGGLEMGALTRFLIDAGKTEPAIEYFLDRWGEPIKAGQTTCGEEFFHNAGNSDCHIHGATPARDFLEYLAGIKIKTAFWDEVLLVPPVDSENLPTLKASVPTPHGKIEVEIAKNQNGAKIYRYKLPAGCRGFIRTAGIINQLEKSCGQLELPAG